MKGILLAGGKGTRLNPITNAMNKHLLPVYNKPMIYYPLSMLMLSGIRDILLISSSEDLEGFKRLFLDGSQWGLNISYAVQDEPNGIAEALIIGEKFIGNESVCLILGDNIFYGTTLPDRLMRGAELKDGATIFAIRVADPRAYAVITYEVIKPGVSRVITLEEKPKEPKSDFAVPGLYFYDNQCVEIAKNIQPSGRGELEITDVNRVYLEDGNLNVEILGRGIAWLDAGTHHALLQASHFIQTVEERQGMMISSPEEIAYRRGFISKDKYKKVVDSLINNGYRRKLETVLDEA